MLPERIWLNGADWQMKGFVGEEWLWKLSHKPESRDWRGWHSAAVPGGAHNDLWQAGVIPSPYQAMNSLLLEWIPERTWVYKKTFSVTPAYQGRRMELVFEGVDYSARYYLNGEYLGASAGTFLSARFDVGDRLVYGGQNLLAVVIDPAPFEQPQVGYTSKVRTQKPRMNYWWDFQPRMINIGLFGDAYIHASGPARIEDVWVQSELADDYRTAKVAVTVALDNAASAAVEVEVRVEPQSGAAEAQRQVITAAGERTARAEFTVADPELWWTNGLGGQPLYTCAVALRIASDVSDTKRVEFGIRKIEFVANEGAAPGALPYTLRVNGRRQYIQGWNWVPIDALYGVERPAKRERLLRLAQNAHVNLLRVWGGGLIEKEAFYHLCDKLGILVWQEFIQSSSGIDNVPPTDPDFIDLLVRTAEQAIIGRRNHPALAVWCGGNELHVNGQELCDDSFPAVGALYETVRRLDPGRHWVPTSPAGGQFAYQVPETPEQAARMQDVHGPWEYQGQRAQYALYNGGDSLLHSEFGVEGLTNLRALNATIPPEQQAPVALTSPVWDHLGAWWVKERVWLDVWGALPDVATTQRATQFMQADGLRYAVEADRRRQYHNSGTMPWQFNEPYPMAACTSAVDYYAEPKPVYYAVARAYRPLTVTARFDTLAWGGESDFRAEIWCSNSGGSLPATLTARVVGHGGRVFFEDSAPVDLPADGSRALREVRVTMALITGEAFFLDLALRDAAGSLLAENRYLFSALANLAPLLITAPAAVSAAVEKSANRWRVTLENTSRQPALWAWLEAEKPDLAAPEYAYFSDNYFCLLPGEHREITITWDGVAEEHRRVRVMGWSFAAVDVGT